MFSLPVVLMYHSIAVPQGADDPFSIHVSPESFRNQMRALSQNCDTVSLLELADDLRSGRLRRNAVAVTFDDAYANNLLVAAPILREFNIPATLFVPTGFLGDSSFWWDRLFGILFSATRCPRTLSGIHEALDGLDDLLARYQSAGSARGRQAFGLKVWSAIQPLKIGNIQRILGELESRFEPQLQLEDLRPMSEEEVSEAAGTFEIGAHTVTHPPMGRNSTSDLEFEVARSKSTCEALAGREVTSFAYPYGHFDQTAVDAVSRQFKVACTTREAALTSQTKLLQVPRIQVNDWPASILTTKIETVARMSRLPEPLRKAVLAVLQPRKAAVHVAQRLGLLERQG